MNRKRRRKPSPGSVFQRGQKWSYAFQGPKHPLTGLRERITKSGFETEEEAWDGMADARAALSTETYVRPTKAKVSDFFEAWFPYIRTTTEPTTAANYETLARAYVLPWIGRRPIQDVVPSVVAALYSHLLAQGRRKRDTSWDMYRVWQDARTAKREIRPREIADKVGVTYAAARKAVQRYEAGRIPGEPQRGLSPKTVKIVHIMPSSAMTTAVRWKYLSTNPTEGVKPPSVAKRTHSTWSPKELARFLEIARTDRLYGLWVLVASTGMRRSELCGLQLSALDLDNRTVRMTTTRVVAGGKASRGSGKSPGSRRQLALDRFTTQVLREHLRRLSEEQEAFGEAYQDNRLIFCWEDGRPIYPDTITERFNRLVELAQLPLIRLHDVRHSYATIALRSGVHPKIVSSRLGHATVAFTLDTYSADVPDLDQQAAEDIGALFLPPPEEDST